MGRMWVTIIHSRRQRPSISWSSSLQGASLPILGRESPKKLPCRESSLRNFCASAQTTSRRTFRCTTATCLGSAMEMGVQDMDTAVIHLRFAAAHEGILSADPTYHTLPTQFYAKSLRRKIVVVHGPCCDREVAEVRAELEKDWGDAEFVMQSAGRCEDFIAMYAARNLVISVSTFAWWAGFLGRGEFEKRVFYPYHAQVPLLHPARMRRWFNRLLPTCESESRFHAVEYTSRRPSLLRKQLGGLMRPVRSVGNLQRMAAKASPKAGMPRSKSHQHRAGR